MARTETLSDEQNASVRRALRRLMAEKKWSQRTTAKALGITQQTVSAFLAGTSGTGRSVADSIAKLLGEPIGADGLGVEAVVGKEAWDKIQAKVRSKPVVFEEPAWGQKAQLLNDCFERAFRAGDYSLVDVDVARRIVIPLLIDLPLPELEDLALETMVPLWLDLIARRRKEGRGTTTVSLILSLSQRLVGGPESLVDALTPKPST